MVIDSRPVTRWWWFADSISTDDIDEQLDWISANGFGRVEIAWVYPTLPESRPAAFLGPEWRRLVAYAAGAAADRGLGCDFTLGTLWPFGGSFVPPQETSMTAWGPSEQRLSRSWEVHSEGLWARDLDELFESRYGYAIRDWLDRLHDEPHRRYDYRELIGQLALDRFFRPLARLCREAGCTARVQAHGAPTDLIAAYAECDIPESETMLFDPPFSLIAASAAAWVGKPLVSCETFTCIYGWVPHPGPGPHQGKERIDDLKLVADAGFARELPLFNRYLADVSGALREGKPCAAVACYLPTEQMQMQMRGVLPEPDRRPSALHHWEMHYARVPEALDGYRPLWINTLLLEQARVLREGEPPVIVVGPIAVRAIVVDTAWLPYAGVQALLRIAREGGRTVLLQRPFEPGTRRHDDYDALVEVLSALSGPLVQTAPLVDALDDERLPEFFCRFIDGHEPRIRYFFAHPLSRRLSYPVPYGSPCARTRLNAAFASPRRRSCEAATAGSCRTFFPAPPLIRRYASREPAPYYAM